MARFALTRPPTSTTSSSTVGKFASPSKRFREEFGHTPLSIEEEIPWKCKRLVIGSGAYGQLPVMDEVKREAERRKVVLLIVPTSQAIQLIKKDPAANAILHVTC